MGATKPLFRDLNADDPEPETTEIESLCMNCHENGMTRILLTKIPFFKEVVVMSFTCEHCGYQNNEIQSGGAVDEKGVKITLKVSSKEDLNRQVVKSDYTSVKIVDLDFEIPSKSQKGEVTTVEGILDRSMRGLEQDQPLRRIQHPEAAEKIDEFITKLKELKDVEQPFTIILEDISGNSFVENPKAPRVDNDCNMVYFTRNKDQNHELGLFTQSEINDEEETGILQPIQEGEFTLEDLEGEVLQFPTNCPSCSSPCKTNMKMTNIPHFKEVVIMATTCDVCGHKTNEVKSGGGIEPKGLKIEVDIKGKEDFSRDILKSETCSLSIPQLDLEVGPHALGGRFTTVEGLVVAIKEQLSDPNHSHMFGDSVDPKSKDVFGDFLKKFDSILAGEMVVTLILDDPAGNSYVQTMNDQDDQVDDRLRIVHYERSFEQNEELDPNSTDKKFVCKEVFWWDGIEIIPPRPKLGLLGNFSNRNADECPNSEESSEELTEEESPSSISSGSEGSAESNPRPRRKLIKRRKQKRKLGTSLWQHNLSARSNQDIQRAYEEKTLREITEFLNKNASNENLSRGKSVSKNLTPVGGVWVRLEAEWRENATHMKNMAKQQPPTPICQSKYNRFKPK